MRDDPTVRMNAAAAAVPDDGSSRTTAVETAMLRTTAAGPDDESAADPGSETATKAAARAAEEGHVPGPGLVIPPAARERRERPGPPADRPVMPDRPAPPDAEQHDRGDGRAPGSGDPSPSVAPIPDDSPSPAGPAPSSTPAARPAPPSEAPLAPSPTAQTVRTAPLVHRPHRPVAAPFAHPAAPARPPGPRRTGPGQPTVAATASGAPRTSDGPSPGRTSAPGRPGPPPRARRAGGIVGGIALGLVAIVAASWTLLVPPAGHDARGEQAAAAPARPAAPAVRWVRTNGDEFDGPALDSTRWNVYNSVGGFGNGLRRPSAVTQGDGLLTITARPRLNGGTSGGISMGRGQLHGRWEFRARADPGVGYSPAVLLWPDSERFPIDGELDMLESPDGARRTASSFVHYDADNKTRGAQVSGDFTQWHTFAFEWLPDRITWYVDGQKSWEIRDRSVIPTKPMHLCIQLDQGPAVKFMPAPDATTPDAVRMQVDWARQYRAG